MVSKQKWTWDKIVLASRNEHKLREFQALFKRNFGIDVRGLNDVDGVGNIVEDGKTFEENAVKKAKSVANILNIPVVADDSGLTVDALGGAPGVYSARYAGEHGDDAANNRKLLHEMERVVAEERTATFVCALALILPDGEEIVVRGECPGRIAFRPRGTNGFGYDPLFELEGRSVTMAELSPQEKDQISHRAKAMQLLADELRRRFAFEGG